MTATTNHDKSFGDMCGLCEWPLDRTTKDGDPCCYKACRGCGLCTSDPQFGLCFECGLCFLRCCEKTPSAKANALLAKHLRAVLTHAKEALEATRGSDFEAIKNALSDMQEAMENANHEFEGVYFEAEAA